MEYFKKLYLLMIVIVIVANTGCKHSKNKAFDKNPTIKTEIEFIYPSIDPANITEDFPVNGKVVIALNKPIDYRTAEASIRLVDLADNNKVTPDIKLDNSCINNDEIDDNIVMFQFMTSLTTDYNYKLIIEGLKDSEGNEVPKTECNFKTSDIDTIINPVPVSYFQSSELIQLKMVAPQSNSNVLLNPFTIQDKGFVISKDGDLDDVIACTVYYDIKNMILNVVPNEKIIITEKNENYTLEIFQYINQGLSNQTLTLESLAGTDIGLASDVTIPLDFLEKLTTSDGRYNDKFGSSVAMSNDGNTIVVGCNYDDVDSNEDQGSIYIYTRDGDILEEKYITASDGNKFDKFGSSVAISGNGQVIVVGSTGDDIGSNENQGSIYIYTRDGDNWEEELITASDGNTSDKFGGAVAIAEDGNIIVVGSSNDDIGVNEEQGSIYIYTRNEGSWKEEYITASDGNEADYFGKEIAISGDGKTIVVGCSLDDIGKNNGQGSVYIFTSDGENWQETSITATNGEELDHFGNSVAVSHDGNTIVIGCTGDNVDGKTAQGSVYVFTRNGNFWDEINLNSENGEENDNIGNSIAISSDGNTIIAGCKYDYVGANRYQGAVYVYRSDGNEWNEQYRTVNDGGDSDYFGNAVAVSGNGSMFVVGSYLDDVEYMDQGSVYIFK